jgi:putative transposase
MCPIVSFNRSKNSSAANESVATGLWPVGEKLDGSHSRSYSSNVTQRFRHRPLRLGRVFDISPLYFVTFCTHDRMPFLAREKIHAEFIEFAKRAERDFNIAVGRYVIMPDHVHLFVRGAPDFVLGRWIARLKQSLARAGNLSRGDTQIWQEGFFDHVLRSDESYAQKWNYVRQNPVRAGLVTHVDAWPYQGEIVYIDRA